MREKIIKLLKNKTVRKGGLFSIFSFFNKGISFLLLMILAKYIDPVQYGSLSLFNTIITFLGFSVGLSTAGYLSVSYFRNKLSIFKIDLTSIILITILGSCIFCVIIMMVNEWATKLLKIKETLLFVAIYISFSSIIMSLWLDFFRVKEKIIKYGYISCGYAITNFIFTLYLVKYQHLGWIGFVYSSMLCNIAFSLFTFFYFIKQKLITVQFDWLRIKKIVLWGLPLIPHSASNWIKQGLDRYIIDDSYSLSEVGIFSFALNLTNIIIMIGVAFNQTNSVSIYKALSLTQTDHKQIVKSLKQKEKAFLTVYVIITILILITAWVIIPQYLPRYISSLYLFSILSLFGLAHCYYLVFCNYLFYFNRNTVLMYITFGLSITHLILSLLLTRYSIYYTCFIYVFSQSLISIFVYIESRKLINAFSNEKIL